MGKATDRALKIDELCAEIGRWKERAEKAEAEVERLRSVIRKFCRAHSWADKVWREQLHIAPLFKIADEEGE